MQLGIFARTFPGSDPEPILAASAKAGYAGVAYNMVCSGLPPMPDAIPPEVLGNITKAAEATGQRLFSLSATYNMAHPDPLVREKGLARLGVLAASARAIGTGLLTLCSGTRDPDDKWRHHPDNATPEAWRDMIASFEGAVEIAEAHDVHLGVEPELANIVNSPKQAGRLINELDSDRIRIVLDPANLYAPGEGDQQRAKVEQAVDVLGDRLAMAHAKDRHQDGTPTAAGCGVIDFDHFLRCLTEAGFNGPLVAHGLPADAASRVAAFLSARLDALHA